jgi:hypothetical protein
MDRVNITPNGDTITVLHGDLRVHQFSGTKYALRSIDSVIELAITKGSREHTVIFYTPTKVQMILDDSIMERPQDYASYEFAMSEAWKEWKAVLDKALSQKEFVDFLRRRPDGELSNIEGLLAVVQRLSLATEIVGDYRYDDVNNVTVMFKTKDAEGSAKLPRTLNLSVILLNESEFISDVEIELELHKPKSEDEKPLFILTCPKLNRYWLDATEEAIDRMKDSLQGWMILAGAMS